MSMMENTYRVVHSYLNDKCEWDDRERAFTVLNSLGVRLTTMFLPR